MSKYGQPDQTLRDLVMQQVEKMLHDPSCEVEMRRGTKQIHDWRKPWVETEPTDGLTLTLKVNGGAVDTTEYRPGHPLAIVLDE